MKLDKKLNQDIKNVTFKIRKFNQEIKKFNVEIRKVSE